jgi:spoIIIJ-associated protein
MQFTGKTVEEATAMALEELKVTADKVEITVIEEPTKGLFGRIKGQAVIEVVKKETDEERALSFVQGILDKMGLVAVAKLSQENEKTVITLIAENSSSIIGYRGEVLDAIQTLAGAALNIGKKEYKKIVVDCENYRDKREETLCALAHKLEAKATEMRREVILEAMSPYERRIIHTELVNSQTVTTKSEGKEPNRYVVIVPNDKDEYSKPYNAGRNNSGRNDKNRSRGKFDKKRDNRGGKNKRFGERKGGSGFIEQKRKAPSGFGTYLGNSLKNKD